MLVTVSECQGGRAPGPQLTGELQSTGDLQHPLPEWQPSLRGKDARV